MTGYVNKFDENKNENKQKITMSFMVKDKINNFKKNYYKIRKKN